MEVQIGQQVNVWLGDCRYNPLDTHPGEYVVEDRQKPFIGEVQQIDDYGRVRVRFTDHAGKEAEFSEQPVAEVSPDDRHAKDCWPDGFVTPIV